MIAADIFMSYKVIFKIIYIFMLTKFWKIIPKPITKHSIIKMYEKPYNFVTNTLTQNHWMTTYANQPKFVRRVVYESYYQSTDSNWFLWTNIPWYHSTPSVVTILWLFCKLTTWKPQLSFNNHDNKEKYRNSVHLKIIIFRLFSKYNCLAPSG